MKKALLVLLIAGLFSGGVCNAAVTSAQLAKMAQKSSKTPLDALCLAVYEAVKADESKAVDIFKSVMSQRDTWTATETYAILRSILLASPALEQGFVQNAAAYNNNPGSYVPVAVDSLGYQLLSTLYTIPQTQPVASVVAQGVVGSTITGQAVGNGITSDSLEAFVPNAPATAPETSPNN